MKRILLISHELSVTGAPNSLLRQATYLREAGYIVDVCSLQDGALKQRYIEKGFNPVIIGHNLNKIKKYIEKYCLDYDLAICNTISTYNAIYSLQLYKIPTVWFIRETKLVDKNIENNGIFKKLFSSFYNLYTVSEYAADVIKKYNDNVNVIHNAIFDTCQDVKIEQNDKNIINFGYIGSLIEVKGIDVLLDAFLNLYKENKNINLYIAGKILNTEYVKNLLEKTKGIENIKWLGEVQLSQKEDFYNNIDVLCIPSLDDPCPLTVIEGAMRSKVLVTTENTGSNFIIKNNESGYIVKISDVADLQKAMERVTVSDIPKMKKVSREMYLEYGTTEREKREVLSMIEETLKKEVPNMRLRYRESKMSHIWNILVYLISFIHSKEDKRIRFKEKYYMQKEIECL